MLDTLLLFGATGDLAGRYLFPSLLHLLRDRLLPEEFRIVAIGRSEHDPRPLRERLRALAPTRPRLQLLPLLIADKHGNRSWTWHPPSLQQLPANF